MNADMTVNDVIDTLNWEQRDMLYHLVGYALETGRNYLAGNGDFDNHIQRKLRKIYNDLNKEQKIVVTYSIKEAKKEYRNNKEKGNE